MLAVAEQPASYSEDAVAALWSRAHTLVDTLVTEAGERMRVIYPGRRSSQAGPDFRDAVLITEDGRKVHGDVEIHTSAPSWYSHGHHEDANYNSVVLHVVFSPKGHTGTRQLSGTDAPVISLRPVARELDDCDSAKSPSLPTLEEIRTSEDVASLLDAAGDARFQAKVRGFVLEINELGGDDALYRGLMDALGYATNRKPFRTLADCIPYATLSQFRCEPHTTRLLAIKAALLVTSGLVTHMDDSEDPALLRRLHKGLPMPKPMKKNDWRLFRVRPSNHPVQRILGASHLINDSLDLGLTETFSVDLAEGGHKSVLARLERPAQIGRARAIDILVNVLLPFLHAHAEISGDEQLKASALESYKKAPKLQENEITREMARICGIDGGLKLTARRQQGLIHIYKAAVHRSHV